MRAHGFTLLEVILVLILASILAAVVSVRLNGSDMTASYQAQRLARDFRHAQMLAMAWGETLRFSVVGTGTYEVTCASGSATPPCAGTNPVTDPATGAAFRVTLSNDATLAGAATDINSLGAPVSAGAPLTANRVFTLTAAGQAWSVTVSPISGFVAVASP